MPAARTAVKNSSPVSAILLQDTERNTVLSAPEDGEKLVRLHITPFTPALLKLYLAPSVLPLAQNISFHTVETFPERGFGFVELPSMEAQKLKKKLNGSTLKGSKVRIEDAKPEKRKATEEADALKENEERPAKRSKRDKKKKEQGLLEGIELPDDRKVKRGWTEPPTKARKDKHEKKDKVEKKSKPKESKYTKEPEMLFKAKLTPVAATEVASKTKGKKDKKDKKSKSAQEVIVHEFAKSSKQPSFLKVATPSAEKKPAVEYINGQGWVDEDGNVVEAETGKARNRRVLELVDAPQASRDKKPSATPSPTPTPAPEAKPSKRVKGKKPAPAPSPSSSEAEESSEVSSSSEDDSESDSESISGENAEPAAEIRTPTPQISLTPSSPIDTKEVHPLEALFKRKKPPPLTSTPQGLAINTSFSFFDNENDDNTSGVAGSVTADAPFTPRTERDIEWRGLRSAAPTPDTAAIGRRFSFAWRKGSQEVNEADEDDNVDIEAGEQLTSNTRANASSSHLPGLAEESEGDEEDENDADSDGAVAGAEEEHPEKEESEFRKWFYENRGDLNRSWKKRRRDALKAKRLSDNRKAVGGRQIR